MVEYIPVLIFLLVAALIPVSLLVVGWLLRPAQSNRVKAEAYECGVPSNSDARARYPIRFYIVAVLFVVFDVETIFLFPWAVKFRHLGMTGFVTMLVFLAVLLVGYAYAWKKKALEWV